MLAVIDSTKLNNVKKIKTFTIASGHSPSTVYLHNKANRESRDFNGNTGSFIGGFDFYSWHASLATGFALSYSRSSITWKESAGKGTMDSGYLAWFINGTASRFFYNGALLGTLSSNYGQRNIFFISSPSNPFPNQQYKAKHQNAAYGIFPHVDCGVTVGNTLKFRPSVGLDYLFTHEGSYTDKQAQSLNLNVSSSNSSLFRGKIGASWFSCISYKDDYHFISEVGIALVQEWRWGGNYQASFVGQSCIMNTKGLNPNRTLAMPQAKLSFQSQKKSANRLSVS